MTPYPFIRSAHFILGDFLKSGPKDPDGFAGQQAKQMMGAGSSALGREAGSTYCSTCTRWHRAGAVCPNMGKALQNSFLQTWLLKGRGIQVSHPEGGQGNAYHDPSTGQFTNAPKSGSAHAEVALEKLRRMPSGAPQTGQQEDDAEKEFAREEPTKSTPRESVDQMLAAYDASRGNDYRYEPKPYTGGDENDFMRESPTVSTPRDKVDAHLAANPPQQPPPVPAAIQGLHTLLSMKPEAKQATDPGQKLQDNSSHLQNQHTSYLNSLRDWQTKYSGSGTGAAA